MRESAAEALEFTRERAVSAVGKGTLEHRTAVVAELDRTYPRRPVSELLRSLGHHPLAEASGRRCNRS
jgi:hypothetical protein